jgi:hypothetical protein
VGEIESGRLSPEHTSFQIIEGLLLHDEKGKIKHVQQHRERKQFFGDNRNMYFLLADRNVN